MSSCILVTKGVDMNKIVPVLKELIAMKEVTDMTTTINKAEQKKAMQKIQNRISHFCWTR